MLGVREGTEKGLQKVMKSYAQGHVPKYEMCTGTVLQVLGTGHFDTVENCNFDESRLGFCSISGLCITFENIVKIETCYGEKMKKVCSTHF
mgnify:CR=1 FL=1